MRPSSSPSSGQSCGSGITNDRKERLDRRLDEAAGFAIPFLPRSLDEIPRSPNDQDAVITVRSGGQVRSNSSVVLPKLGADYADTYLDGVRWRVRTVEIRAPDPMSVAVGATYDDTYAETNNLHRRVLVICAFAIGAAAVLGWLLATFAVRPFRRLAEQTRMIDAGDEAPEIEVRGATEAVEIGEAMKGMLARVWEEQDRTKAALASARDFAAVSAHELRTPLTAMRTNLEVLSTLDLPDEQRSQVLNDVIRTQSRIEATLGALERLAQGELITDEDHVPVDITELLDRAAHDAMRVYPDLDVSLVPAPTMILLGLPAGLRLAVDNAIANAVKHGHATRVQLRQSVRGPGSRSLSTTMGRAYRRLSAGWCSSGSPAGRRRRARARVSAWRSLRSRPKSTGDSGVGFRPAGWCRLLLAIAGTAVIP